MYPVLYDKKKLHFFYGNPIQSHGRKLFIQGCKCCELMWRKLTSADSLLIWLHLDVMEWTDHVATGQRCQR